MAAKKKAAPKKALTKSEILGALAEDTGLAKKDVASVFESLGGLIGKSLGRSGSGTFTVPGLLKVKTVKKPARKAQKNVPNPFKPGETMDGAAKPATTKVKVVPLKRLKDMV